MLQSPVLLWITEHSIWSASENLHLYYRLRQGYKDQQLLHDKPGHLFQGYETAELATFLQIALLNGWGGYVLSHANEMNLFFSHDGFIDFFSSRTELLSSLRSTWLDTSESQ